MRDRYQERIEDEKLLQTGFVLQLIECNRRIEPLEDRKVRLEERKEELEGEMLQLERDIELIKTSPAGKLLVSYPEDNKYRSGSPTKVGLIARAVGYAVGLAAVNMRNVHRFEVDPSREAIMRMVGVNALYVGGVSLFEGVHAYMSDARRIEKISRTCTPDFLEECLAKKKAEYVKCNQFIKAVDTKLRKERTLRGQAKAGVEATTRNIENFKRLRLNAIYTVFMEYFAKQMDAQYKANEENGDIKQIDSQQVFDATFQRTDKPKSQKDAFYRLAMEFFGKYMVDNAIGEIQPVEVKVEEPPKKAKKVWRKGQQRIEEVFTMAPGEAPKLFEESDFPAVKRKKRRVKDAYKGTQITFDDLLAAQATPEDGQVRMEDVIAASKETPVEPAKTENKPVSLYDLVARVESEEKQNVGETGVVDSITHAAYEAMGVPQILALNMDPFRPDAPERGVLNHQLTPEEIARRQLDSTISFELVPGLAELVRARNLQAKNPQEAQPRAK